MVDAPSNMYVLVCTDLHNAVGPYIGARVAIDEARRLSLGSKCEYLPVPLTFIGEVHFYDGGEPKTEDVYPTGQYL